MESLVLSRADGFDFSDDNLNSFKEIESTPIETDGYIKLGRNILTKVLQFRRSPNSSAICGPSCAVCHSIHLPKITYAIKNSKPLTFILPAFPGKSPNLSKVLSPLPDMAEQIALKFLQQLCEQIKSIYEPGAKIILCSDGRVFSDVVGMREADVTQYQDELDKMIEELHLHDIKTFHLDELCKGKDFNKARKALIENFGASIEVLRKKVLNDEETHRMYCGITRFLVEDSTFPGQTKSRSALQKECKAKAYDVIRRSNAWSEFIAQRFPEAVRLSIHPQACGSKKLGIKLIGSECWMTPWHGVAVETDKGYVLLKRSAAEALGAKLIYGNNGRPSHYRFLGNQLLTMKGL
ncbi:MAG: L-tyrosine/L-tryptophan isonitrile synthase family protein [Bdellovibrio sp.]